MLVQVSVYFFGMWQKLWSIQALGRDSRRPMVKCLDEEMGVSVRAYGCTPGGCVQQELFSPIVDEWLGAGGRKSLS